MEATPTMPAMSMAATPSAAKSMKGEVVVSWMTAAEMRPMMRAWPMLGRTTRIVRQKAEMMNSGLIMPPEMDEMALPTVKLRMKPAASRMASSTSAWRSSLPRLLVVTVRACWVFSDMVVNLSVVPGWSSELLAMWVGASRTLPRYEKGPPVEPEALSFARYKARQDSPSTERVRVAPPPVVVHGLEHGALLSWVDKRLVRLLGATIRARCGRAQELFC